MWGVVQGLACALVVVLLLLSGQGQAGAHPFLVFSTFQVPTLAVVVAAALAGGIVAWSFRDTPLRRAVMKSGGGTVVPGRGVPYAIIQSSAAVIIGVLLCASIPPLTPPRAAAAYVLSLLALLTAAPLIEMLRVGEPVGIESHWGGLGGGSGGWRLLPTTVLALLTLSFVGAALTVLVAEPASAAKPPPPAATPTETGGKPGAKPAPRSATPAADHRT